MLKQFRCYQIIKLSFDQKQMFPSSKNKTNITNFPLGICLTPSSQYSTGFKNKKFSRKRENSIDSLNSSRVSYSRGLQSDRDNQPKKFETPKKPNQSNKKQEILTIIKNTSYIKPKHHSFKTDKKQINALNLTSQNSSRKFSRKNSDADNNKFDKINNNEIMLNNKNRCKDDEEIQSQKFKLFNENQRLSTISNCYQPSEFQLQLDIKSKQLMILEDENIRLKNAEQKNLKAISKLQSEKQILKIENSQLKKQIRQSTVKVWQIIDKYSQNTKNQQTKFENNLSGFINQNLLTTIEAYIQKISQSYEDILMKLQQKLKIEQNLNCKLLVKTNFYEKFRNQNQELRCVNSRVNQQLNRMKKRNTFLVDQNTSLRITSSKLRKSFTDLKKIRNEKQKQEQKQKQQEKIGKVQKQQNLQLSLDDQQPIIHRTKDKITQKMFDDFDAVTESDNSNNLSLNISDVSTQELMQMQDLL